MSRRGKSVGMTNPWLRTTPFLIDDDDQSLEETGKATSENQEGPKSNPANPGKDNGDKEG